MRLLELGRARYADKRCCGLTPQLISNAYARVPEGSVGLSNQAFHGMLSSALPRGELLCPTSRNECAHGCFSLRTKEDRRCFTITPETHSARKSLPATRIDAYEVGARCAPVTRRFGGITGSSDHVGRGEVKWTHQIIHWLW
jgi:hypothetical protein